MVNREELESTNGIRENKPDIAGGMETNLTREIRSDLIFVGGIREGEEGNRRLTRNEKNNKNKNVYFLFRRNYCEIFHLNSI